MQPPTRWRGSSRSAPLSSRCCGGTGLEAVYSGENTATIRLISDIGKLPDTNLAESLQRITGVSIDRSGGEGAFVTVRGFGPEFNTVLLNGRQIATPTDPARASGRAFSFDSLASELVSGVEVFKSSTAHLQSGGVGAAIDIKTARPFDYSGLKFSGSADSNYDENAKKASPDAAFLVSDRHGSGLDRALGSAQRAFAQNEALKVKWTRILPRNRDLINKIKEHGLQRI